MSVEAHQLQEEIIRLEDEILRYQRTMVELKHHSDIQNAINEILNISLLSISLEKQLEGVLLLILNISWLALERKGCIFLTDKKTDSLNMVVHHNLGKPLLTMCEKVSFGSCLCGKAAGEQSLLFRHCIDHDHHHRPDGIEPHGHYIVPIVSKNKTLGVLNLYVKHGYQQKPIEINFLNASGKALAGIIERKLIEKELHRLSYMDELTGVANRRKFMEVLSGEIDFSNDENKSLAVLFLDLDFFKVINDSYGHEYGDQILIKVAHRIQICLRDIDLIARLGGDEFVILLEIKAKQEESSLQIAQKLIQIISKPYNIKGKSLSIGASIGISLYPQHDSSANGLLEKADHALYGAKETRGRAMLYST